MLPLLDTQVRLVLLNHVAVRLAEAQPDELHAWESISAAVTPPVTGTRQR